MRQHQVFVPATGQDDNLGDSVLRRGLLEGLRAPGVQLNVFVGSSSLDYQSGLGLRGDDRLYRPEDHWRRDVVREVSAGRGSFVYNAGEVQVANGALRSNLIQLGINVAGRARGHGSIQTGVGIRDVKDRWAGGRKAALRRAAIVSWRDAASRDAAGIGSVNPDWAFALGGEAADRGAQRRFLTVTMRHDRPAPDEAWLRAVMQIADSHSLTIAVVTQVRRDLDRAQEIASAVGGELLAWESGSHAEWEIAIRAHYRQTALLVSDRLHALVIGLTEGAVPLGLTTASDEKLRRTLDAAALPACTLPGESAALAPGLADAVLAQSSTFTKGALEARQTLAELAAQIRSTYAGAPS